MRDVWVAVGKDGRPHLDTVNPTRSGVQMDISMMFTWDEAHDLTIQRATLILDEQKRRTK